VPASMSIDIIVPVFNAPADLRRCLESVRAHTDGDYRLILINDASTDPDIAEIFQSLRDLADDRIWLFANDVNRGFVATVNRGMQLGRNDVVLLNTDTVVTPGWLARLRTCIASDAAIATATPWSNNAEICSLPHLCGNTPEAELDVPSLLEGMAAAGPAEYPDLPTGVGFCLYIRRDALNAIGSFDEAAFGRGYGEENDFCLRAAQGGWRNVLCDDALVLHRGGASFGELPAEQRAEKMQRLLQRHPDYLQRVQAFIAADPLYNRREKILLAMEARSTARYDQGLRLLLVSHALGGGVQAHVDDIARLLGGSASVEVLQPVGTANLCLREVDGVERKFAAQHWDSVVRALAARHYDGMLFHHVHGFPSQILDLPQALSTPYSVTLHDFSAYCPQYALTDVRGHYCGEPAIEGCGRCVADRPHPWQLPIEEWRRRWGQFLHAAVQVIAPSQTVAGRMLRHYPSLSMEIIGHPPSVVGPTQPVSHCKVLLLGALSVRKGLETMLACAELARRDDLPFSFVLLGYPERAIPQRPLLPIEVRGEYDAIDLPQRIALERPDVIWFPGLIPETWSYTLDAALAADVPIVASDIGAIAERLQDSGLLLPPQASPEAWLEALEAAASQAPAIARPAPAIRADHGDRAAYCTTVLRPHSAAAGAGVRRRLSLRLAQLPPPQLEIVAELPLTVLFEHGVEAGHRASRLALRQRLLEAERDYAVLQAWEEESGRPWYEYREHLLADNAGLSLQVRDLQAQTEALRSELAQSQQAAAAERALLSQARDDATVLAGLLEQQRDRAVQQLMAFERSTSWRVTAPMRALARAVGSPRRRLGALLRLVRQGYQRLPLMWQILRDDGADALWQRIRHKLVGLASQHAAPEPPPTVTDIAIAALHLPTVANERQPRVSIVIPTYGQHRVTFNCLYSIALYTDLADVEIIVIDDAHAAPLQEAMPEVTGVRLLRNAENLGFIGSCAAGTAAATGEFLVLLNNDVQVTEGWLLALLDVFALRDDAGMVGARLIYPDGRLQEAGGIVWRDGSAWNWGRDGDPEDPRFRYLRRADYCSGACLALRRSVWESLGGFDDRYRPAYYEDTDLAFRIRELGLHVYYQPQACLIHAEGVSSGTDTAHGVKRYQVINAATFHSRWAQTLAQHGSNGAAPEREADRGTRARVLVVEACMITPDQDSGSVRMLALLELLVELDCKVSFVADNLEYRQPYVRQLQQAGVEVWHHPYLDSVEQLFETRGDSFDLIVLCRHYVAQAYLSRLRQWAPQATVVFDTVDLHYLREQRLAELEGSSGLAAAAARTREQELRVIHACDVTLVVSTVEQRLLAQEMPEADVRVLSNIHEVQPEASGFASRSDLLFVGGFQHPPNVDAVRWFLLEVWPLVHAELPDVRVRIVGSRMPESLRALEGPGIELLGFVEDITPLLRDSRLSIAPLRYGAGVKGKINQAMAWGLPVVATGVAVEGMNLVSGEDVVLGDSASAFAAAVVALYRDPALWARVAAGGRQNVEQHFSRACARSVLKGLLEARRPARAA
jgi:O-antigen biosynthesis protein